MRTLIQADGRTRDFGSAALTIGDYLDHTGAHTLDVCELKHLEGPHVMLVDHLAKRKDLPPNVQATVHFWRSYPDESRVMVLGPAVICPRSDLAGAR